MQTIHQAKHTNAQGFTLIELVIVIVILGILAATAMPKFVGLSADARASVMKSVEGSMRAANTIIFAKAAANGVEQHNFCNSTATCGGNEPVVINGEVIGITYGYAHNTIELMQALDISAPVEFDGLGARIEHNDAIAGSKCSVTYERATLSGGVVVAPKYTLDVSACD